MDIQTVKARVGGGYIVDGTRFVPDDPANRDHLAVQRWIMKGSTPAPADPAPPFRPDRRDILLEALRAKTGLTAADLTAARATLTTRGRS